MPKSTLKDTGQFLSADGSLQVRGRAYNMLQSPSFPFPGVQSLLKDTKYKPP